MSQGWIKLYRQIQDCWIWEASTDEPFSRGCAWIDILLSCNHADKKTCFDGKPCIIKRGEYMTSIVKLGERWGWGRKKVATFLDALESDGMIEQDRNKRRTVIKVLNYSVYQSFDDDEGTSKEHRKNISGTSEEHQRNINNNDKNIKNEKNVNKLREVYFPGDDILNQTFAEFVLMRKNLKKPFTTDHAIQLAIDKLMKLSDNDNDIAIQILNQSIENSWQGLFPIKEQSRQQARPKTIAEQWEGVDFT